MTMHMRVRVCLRAAEIFAAEEHKDERIRKSQKVQRNGIKLMRSQLEGIGIGGLDE